MLYTKNSNLSNTWHNTLKNTNIFLKEHKPKFFPFLPYFIEILKNEKGPGNEINKK